MIFVPFRNVEWTPNTLCTFRVPGNLGTRLLLQSTCVLSMREHCVLVGKMTAFSGEYMHASGLPKISHYVIQTGREPATLLIL